MRWKIILPVNVAGKIPVACSGSHSYKIFLLADIISFSLQSREVVTNSRSKNSWKIYIALSVKVTFYCILWAQSFLSDIVSQRNRKVSDRRPHSAFPHHTSDTRAGVATPQETKRELDAVENELRRTTALIQRKLSIQPSCFINLFKEAKTK